MRHERLATCASTNDEARAAFEAGAPLPLLVSAAEQTAGRGRQGRSWSHAPANFAGSFVIEASPRLVETPGAVAFLAGLAVTDALATYGISRHDLRLKWPNDVLYRERKVAGVLSEFVEALGRRAFIVGIGVNLAEAPGETRFPAAAAFSEHPPEPARFAESLAAAVEAWTNAAAREGPGRILAAWRSQAWRLGQPLAVRGQGPEPAEGIFEDIDDRGHLLLRLPCGTLRRVAAGDIADR